MSEPSASTRAAPRAARPAYDLANLPAHPAPAPSQASAPTPAAPTPAVAWRQSGAWRRTYARALIAVDAVAVLAAGLLALLIRTRLLPPVNGGRYLGVAFAAVPVWLFFLAAGRAYEQHLLGGGADELRRVFDGSVRLIAVVALVDFLGRLDVSRRYLGLAFVIGTVLLLLGRQLARLGLRRARRSGRALTRLVVLGDRRHVEEVVKTLHRDKRPAFEIVGACLPGGTAAGVPPSGAPVVGSLTTVLDAVRRTGADAVAVTASRLVDRHTLRRLAWDLEGTGIALVVAPTLLDVAGPRIHVRPAAGLPLLYVEEPEFTGARRVLKGLFDRVLALAALLVLSPALGLVGLAVRLSSPGPAIFRQTRVGRGGEEFCVYKFRSMYRDAEARLAALRASNEGAGLLFKMRNDPRVTPVGRVLRKFSLDELPQLFNVLLGSMAIVGPRPPLPSEVAAYGGDVRRRLLVKPGITGLWQVSGRSDLPWDEAVRLDLYYVENWSLALDLQIIWQTVFAVLRGSGAY